MQGAWVRACPPGSLCPAWTVWQHPPARDFLCRLRLKCAPGRPPPTPQLPHNSPSLSAGVPGLHAGAGQVGGVVEHRGARRLPAPAPHLVSTPRRQRQGGLSSGGAKGACREAWWASCAHRLGQRQRRHRSAGMLVQIQPFSRAPHPCAFGWSCLPAGRLLLSCVASCSEWGRALMLWRWPQLLSKPLAAVQPRRPHASAACCLALLCAQTNKHAFLHHPILCIPPRSLVLDW